MNIKINELNLHVSSAHKLSHTNILQKRQLQQRKKKTALLQTRLKASLHRGQNKHAYICIKCYCSTQMLFLQKNLTA